MAELIIFLFTITGWQTASGNMTVAQEGSSVHITGQGTCYLDLTQEYLPSDMNGLSFLVRGEGAATARLMLDMGGSAYGVADRFTAGPEAREISLAKEDAVLVQMLPPMEGAPDRVFLFLESAEPVNITVWGLETW
jgi:hypothetical protein